MLTCYRVAARTVLLPLILAVFFSRPSAALDRPLTSLESGMTDLVYDLSRSVVTVESFRRVSTGPGIGTEAIQNVVSSGIVCDTFGNILALAPYVVGKERILVEFEGVSIAAKLVAVDYYSDLALIHVDRRIGVPARFSDKQVCAGQMVIAMGNAYGLRASPALGFCAGCRQDGNLQFSVPVTSSAVGGGVFDLSGHLIGIMTGNIGQDNRVALAVPGYQVPSVIAYLKTHGDREAGYIGIQTADIEITPPLEITTPFTFASAGTPGASGQNLIDQGVLVTSVVDGSPADQAGLEKGDLVLAIDNRRLVSATEFSGLVRQAPPGASFNVTFIRHTTLANARITVGSRAAYHLQPMYEAENASDISPKVDSLTAMLNYLKSEVGRLEERMQRLK
jgi:S1-C subfamily serine protease